MTWPRKWVVFSYVWRVGVVAAGGFIDGWKGAGLATLGIIAAAAMGAEGDYRHEHTEHRPPQSAIATDAPAARDSGEQPISEEGL